MHYTIQNLKGYKQFTYIILCSVLCVCLIVYCVQDQTNYTYKENFDGRIYYINVNKLCLSYRTKN